MWVATAIVYQPIKGYLLPKPPGSVHTKSGATTHAHTNRDTYLWRGDFNVDNDGGQGGFGQLGGVVDGVCIQHHQLQRLGQLKDPLDLTLDFSCKEHASELSHVVK